MATITKNFKIKNGLIVEGSTATVNGNDILTKSASDTTYIQGLVGGVANSEAVANAIVLRDANASFAANVVTADLVGDVTGTVSDISNHDTDSLAEGTTNKYFSNSLARDAFSAGAGIAAITNGVIEVNLSTGLEFRDGTSGGVRIDRDETDTWYDAAGSADTAQTNAQIYANNLIDDTGTSMTTLWSSFNTSSQIDTAQTNAQNYADGLASNYDAAGSADTAQTNAVTIANAYTDDAVANLVNGAPELLDTLNELAAALDDNPNVIADLQDIAAGKQDTLTAGANIDITSNTISVTGLDTDDVTEGTNLYFTDSRAVTAVSNVLGSGLFYSPTGSTIDVQLGTGLIANGSNQIEVDRLTVDTWYDAAGSADTAQTNAVTIANSYTDTEIGALTTKDVAEDQDYLYFTDQRAKDAATVLLTQEATLNNITITSDLMNGLVITAENGVADSTTDDLAQGTTNLYFSNALAVSALEAVTPNFQSVDITWVRREEATWTDANTAGTHTAHTFSSAEGSVKYLVRIFNNGHSQVSEVLVTTDSSNNIAVTEYAIIYTSENPLATVTADWDSGNSEYRLRVTTANNNSEILVAATMLAYND